MSTDELACHIRNLREVSARCAARRLEESATRKTFQDGRSSTRITKLTDSAQSRPETASSNGPEHYPRVRTVECEICGATNKLRQSLDVHYRCGNCHAPLHCAASGHRPLPPPYADMRECVTCEKRLDKSPAILVNSRCFCFCHAKEDYRNAVAARQARQDDLNLEHEKQMARFKERQATHDRALNEWVARRDAAAKGRGLGIQEKLAIVVFTAMGLCGIHPAVGVLSIPFVWFVLICIDSNMFEKAATELQRVSPRPVFNETPPRRVTVPEVVLRQHPGNNTPTVNGVGYDRLTLL